MESSWIGFGLVLESFWTSSGLVVDLLWTCCEAILDWFWTTFGLSVDWSCTAFGLVFDWFRTRFGLVGVFLDWLQAAFGRCSSRQRCFVLDGGSLEKNICATLTTKTAPGLVLGLGLVRSWKPRFGECSPTPGAGHYTTPPRKTDSKPSWHADDKITHDRETR